MVMLGAAPAWADSSGSSSGAGSGSGAFGSSGSAGTSGPELTPPTPAIELEGARNFRDIGGYRTADGRTVRTGIVFRSNRIDALTDLDLAKLTAAGITLDVDLRAVWERDKAHDRVPAGARYLVADVFSMDGLSFHEFPAITLGRVLIEGLITGSSDSGSAGVVQTINYPFLVNSRGADLAFRTLLTSIAGNTGGATLYHCTDGKGRTGWATAVLLTLLGVPRETVNADFLASNDRLGNPNAVQLTWLEDAFAEADRLYGSFDGYVREGLRLDQATIDALRARLLM
ncbi:tyrosine-protein phosphatase [Nocardia sp. 2]|uniref:Tyrosine-protein phosphatase n=2 Tax=Nocardia acididurans TaxID=2802282 RepID=A0ABS1M3U8_9NOCA|nr:tyrosine-protein phosphatase [Nocardia acididurans]